MKKQVSPVVTVIVILVVVVIVALIWSYLGQSGKMTGSRRLPSDERPVPAQASPADREKAAQEAAEMSRAAQERVTKQLSAEKGTPSPAPAKGDE